MRYIDQLDVAISGVTVQGTIAFDYDLARIASLKTVAGLPLVSHWLDPLTALSKPNGVKQTIRDAASTAIYGQSAAATGVAPTRDTSLNGMPTMVIPQGTPGNFAPEKNSVNLDPNAWSVGGVFNITPTTTDDITIFSKGDNQSIGVGGLWPSLRVDYLTGSGDRLIVAEVSTSTARAASGYYTDLRGRTVWVLATFSTALGLRIYLNGVLVATNAADLRPLNWPNVGFLANTTAGTSQPAHGKFGWQMVFRGDLSNSDYSGSRLILDEIVKRKYAIV